MNPRDEALQLFFDALETLRRLGHPIPTLLEVAEWRAKQLTADLA